MTIQRTSKLIKRVIIYGGTAGILTLLILWFLTNLFATMASSVPPAARPALSQEFLAYPASKESVSSVDGKNISFWYFPTSDSSKKPTLIILHGFGASKEHMLTYMLFAQKNGYSVVAIDLRGHGDSDKSLCSFGFYEKQDVLAVMDWLREKGKTRFVLWGTSMGAVTSALTAETQPAGLAGIILDAPFDTLRNTLVHHAKVFFQLPEYPLTPFICWRIGQLANYDTKAINVPRALKSVQVPLLVLAAENDVRMTLPLVRSIYDGANSPKTFYIIPNANHEFRSFEPEYQATILTFLKTLNMAEQ